MSFKIDPKKVNEGLKRSIHADEKYKGKKLETHKPEKGVRKGVKKI